MNKIIAICYGPDEVEHRRIILGYVGAIRPDALQEVSDWLGLHHKNTVKLIVI